MGQKVSPIGFRTGVTLGWKSRWFAPKSNYGEFLVEDARLRAFMDHRLNRQPPFAAISSIEIERTREEVKVTLRTARPGLVIGPKGAEVDKLKAALEDLTDRRVNINIVEVKNPDLDAQLVAEGIAEQLKRRTSYRRAMKQRVEAAMQAGAKGIKIMVSGRLGGADMGRTNMEIQGSIPLHTLEADVDYGFVPCVTTYGTIGVKVWIYRGRFGEQGEESDQVAQRAMTRARRRRETGRRSRPGEDSGSGRPTVRPGGSRLAAQRQAQQARSEASQATKPEPPKEEPVKEEPVKEESAEAQQPSEQPQTEPKGVTEAQARQSSAEQNPEPQPEAGSEGEPGEEKESGS